MSAMRVAVVTMLVFGLLLTAAPERANAQVPDEDAPPGRVIEGADSGREVQRATDVTGGPDAHVAGAWTDPVEWPLSAIHAIVLPDGTVMTYGTDSDGLELNAFTYDVWDPSKGMTPGSHATLPARTSTNLFCSAQTVLPWSGQVMITGGDENGLPGGTQHFAVNDVNLFDPASRTVTRMADSTARARWYPTVTTLPSGEILVHGGRLERSPSVPVLLPEVYHRTRGWRRLTNAESSRVYGGGRWWYPRSWVAPDGDVFIVTKGTQELWSLDPSGRGSLTKVGTYPGASTSNATPAVMFDVGKVLITTEAGTASVIDINGGTPKVTPTAPLDSYRSWSDATVLADGQVLVTGGARERQKLDQAVYATELWNPETGRWRKGAAAKEARLYHSTAILLPDATVLTAGGGPPGPVANLNAEVYHPPYLYRKDGSGELAARPTIAGMGTVRYGGSFSVDVGAGQKISKVALVRTGSVTHSFDMDQRYMALDFQQSGDRLTVSDPRNANVAPPGQYMLFVIDDKGVPSVAELFRLGGGSPPSSAAVQTGTLSLANTSIGGRWITATFKRPFDRTPVVTFGGASRNGGDPVVPRVRNVTKTGFQVKLAEWDYDDGSHTWEDLTYLAAEPGRHTLGGVTIEAGAVTAGSDPRAIRYASPFDSTPVVLTQVASNFDATTVTPRVYRTKRGSFTVRLQEQEADVRAGRRHGEETVHYIALSTGTGKVSGRRMRVRRLGVNTSHRWRGIGFGSSYADPGLIVAMQSYKGSDPATARYRRLTATSAEIKVQEETSYDSETSHTDERFGWVVIASK